MYRVLVFGMTENPGGVESFLMNYFKHIDNTKIHFDFLCNTLNPVAYENQIKDANSNVFHIPPRSKNPYRYKKSLNSFFANNASAYDCIWVNVNSLANIDYLKLAKKYGIERRIIHSHNSKNMDNFLRGILHKLNRNKIKKYATDFWACDESAAEWFYTPKIINKSKIIKNAIDISKNKYSDLKRKKLRKYYSLDNKFVLGNIGRLHFQKNQNFLLDIFDSLQDIIPNSKLVLVGDGPDRKKLEEKANRLGIRDSVIFTGVQQNISDWLSAFDVFVFPSLFEGLPIAALEAQSNGVPIVASFSALSKDAIINKNILCLDLDESPIDWAKKIAQYKSNDPKLNRIEFQEIKDAFDVRGYNIELAAKQLEKMFTE